MWRPILSEPPLCSLKELKDGTYDIDDLADMHEALDAKEEVLRQVEKSRDKK